jgi:co-chaperonin GroES (HSP10)
MSTALKSRDAAPDDPKQELLDKLGDLTEAVIAQNEVLIATYKRPKMSAGGIIMPDQNLKEDQYQGKVGLVVKIGEACRFVRTDPHTGVTYGTPIALHDWVVVRTSDTWTLEINGHRGVSDPRAFVWCRLVYDDQIRMKVPYPEMVW